MKTTALIILGLLTVISGFMVWACGIGVVVVIIACILKLASVEMVANVSYWLPLQLAVGWVACAITTFTSAAITGFLYKDIS